MYIRDETNAETNKKIISNRKETPFPGISGKVGENWALIVQQKQRENWPWVACGRPSVPIGGGSDSASTGSPVADPGCIFTSYKGESWHHNLKTFILVEGVSGKGGEESSVTVLAMSDHVEHDMGPSSALPLCEALGMSLELRSLVHEEGIVVVLPTTSQEY